MSNTNHYPAPGEKPENHPYANLFPMLDGEDIQELANDIRANGQREPIVLLDGKVLDGRNRRDACFIAKKEPFYRFFEPRHDGKSPLSFVMSRNLRRRHLTMSQRAAVAAEALPMFEQESKARQSAAGKSHTANLRSTPAPTPTPSVSKTTLPPPDEFDQRTAGSEAEGKTPAKPSKTMAAAIATAKPAKAPAKTPPKPAQKPTPAPAKPQRGETAAAAAGKALGVSERSVRTAKNLQQKDPAKFEAVKKGAQKLHPAAKKADRESDEFTEALGRIRKVCGRSLADAIKEGTRLPKAKDVLAFAALGDDKMLGLRNLIDAGWDLKRAQSYKAGSLGKTHRIHDLLDRATSQGGTLTLEIEGYVIEVRRKK